MFVSKGACGRPFLMEKKMGKKLDYDPLTKNEQTFHYDHSKKEFTIESKQNVEGILNDSKRSFASSKRSDRHGDLTQVGRIPMNVYSQMARENKSNPEGLQKEVRKFINDPDYRKFRTRPGKY